MLRGIAAVAVVLTHLLISVREYGGSIWTKVPNFFLGNMGVDLFFVISGFVIVWVTKARLINYSSVSQFLLKRFTRIYPIYWVYCCFILGGRLLFFSLSYWEMAGINIPASLLLFPHADQPVILIAWTLEFEVLFYILFALTTYLAQKWAVPAFTGLLLGLVVSGLAIQPVYPFFQLITSPYLLEFLGGFCIGLLALRNRLAFGRTLIISGLVWIAVDSLILSPSLLENTPVTIIERLWRYGVPALFIVYGTLAWERNNQPRFPLLLIRLGDISYTIYLSHLLILSGLGRAWRLLALNDTWIAPMLGPCMLFAVLIWSNYAYQWLERPLITATRKWVRSRVKI